MNQSDYVDLLGVGIGPFNLSLAALLAPVQSIRSYFFDQNESFIWHAGMLLPGAEIQVSFLQDLVTLVDPTSPYSFISYLAQHKRLYRFMNAHFKQILRKEFNNYLNWASRSIPNLLFNERVEDIEFKQNHFVMKTARRTIHSQHLVLGNGLAAHIPECARNYLSPQVFHNKDFLEHAGDWEGKRIAVIGGGQSGAEIINYIISHNKQLPSELTWVTRRNQFSPMDDSAFTNDLFTPNYNEYFFQLSEDKKSTLLKEQSLASDGISLALLETIYQKLYNLEFLENKGRFFKPITHHQLIHIKKQVTSYTLVIEEIQSKMQQIIAADIIILCTGYKWEYPHYLAALADKIPLKKGHFCVNSDFSIVWDGPAQNKIYVQNAARHAHGIADPNLCLMAWRSAKIINSMHGSTVYDLENESSTLIPMNKMEQHHASIA